MMNHENNHDDDDDDDDDDEESLTMISLGLSTTFLVDKLMIKSMVLLWTPNDLNISQELRGDGHSEVAPILIDAARQGLKLGHPDGNGGLEVLKIRWNLEGFLWKIW